MVWGARSEGEVWWAVDQGSGRLLCVCSPGGMASKVRYGFESTVWLLKYGMASKVRVASEAKYGVASKVRYGSIIQYASKVRYTSKMRDGFESTVCFTKPQK